MQKFVNLNKYEKATFIVQNFQAIIGTIGIIANTLAFAVFLRKPLRNHSFSFYFRLICWTDSIILLHTFRHWARIVLDFDVDLLGPLFCQFNEYQPYLFSSTAAWLRNLILFDRLIRVVYPAHFHILRRKWFQISAVSIILLFSALLHIKLPLNYRLKITQLSDNSTRLVCYLPPDILGINFMLTLTHILFCVLFTFIMDIKLISYIFYSRRKLRNKLYKQHSSVVKDRKFAKSSIGVSFFSVLCHLIFGVSTLTALGLRLDQDQIELVFTASVTVAISNSSSVFFLNMFINSVFNNEFYALIGTKKR